MDHSHVWAIVWSVYDQRTIMIRGLEAYGPDADDEAEAFRISTEELSGRIAYTLPCIEDCTALTMTPSFGETRPVEGPWHA